jgi:membrane associated rhomboid family serine protease
MNITLIIIAITSIVSLLAIANRDLFNKLLLSPYMVYHHKQYYRALTHGLIHADFFHLFVNMYVLYSFGQVAEHLLFGYLGGRGILNFIVLYLGGILFAFLPSFSKHKDNFNYNAVGASGAVSAVLFSCIALSPLSSIGIMFIPVKIPAIVFGVLYLIYEAYMDKRGQDYVAHDAHFWGALFGFVYTLLLNKEISLNFLRQLGLSI